jgi:hypothetical protein
MKTFKLEERFIKVRRGHRRWYQRYRREDVKEECQRRSANRRCSQSSKGCVKLAKCCSGLQRVIEA